MEPANFKKAPCSEAEHARLLAQLDLSEKNISKKPRRSSARIEYRVRDIPLTVNHPGGGVGRFLVLARNLSSGGISVLHAGFLHLGTECRLVLTLADGSAKALIGRVVFCRLAASPVHEIGIQFSTKIDMRDFVAPESAKSTSDDPTACAALRPVRGNALIVSADKGIRAAVEKSLLQSGMNPNPVTCAGAAADQARLLRYALAVVDLNLPDPGPGPLLELLAGAGFSGAVIGFAADESDSERDRAARSGITVTINASMPHAAIHAVVAGAVASADVSGADSAPVCSTLAPAEGTEAMIRFFVSAAREAAATISGALGRGDAKAVLKECKTLKSIAGGYGFQAVAESARQAALTLESGGSLADSAGRVTALLDMCARLSAQGTPRMEHDPGRSERNAA